MRRYNLSNTDFAEKVYREVRRIKKGQIATYKEIALAIGKPMSFRAVGNALNKNASKTVPCHRVVKSDLSVGGFNRGTKEKIKRLSSEGIRIKNGKIVSR